MKIALIGYGKMGKAIEAIALQRGHEIVSIIDVDNPDDFDSDGFKSADVAIEFSQPDTALANFRKCFIHHKPVVSGTTGWLNHLHEIKNACEFDNQTFFYAPNYSLGVNIFFQINHYLARIMNGFPEYQVSIEETHHVHKLDAPSGTAISLAEEILQSLERKTIWQLCSKDNTHQDVSDETLLIHSIREGEVPGTHEVQYESEVDTIHIKHQAHNRKGLALGAVLAAEYTLGKKGFLTMKDLLNLEFRV